jgi:NAD(P)-dependent dehydrogenase (short-subunit alcohol dehydrogenase family)
MFAIKSMQGAEGDRIMGLLDGKVAIVTGGTSGIGKRIAEVFVEQGAKVVIAARREEEGRQVQSVLGERARFQRTDVADAVQVKAMVDYAMGCFGQIDCLVNNAGSPSPMVSILDVDMDDFDRVMAINVRGVMLGMKTVVPHMLRRASGSIINMSSGAAFRTGFIAHTYAASKAAVTQLTRTVAAEVGDKGVRVNSISPGAIATGIFGKNAGVEGSQADKVLDVVKESFATLQPVPRSGVADDIANAAVFLASDLASFVHGHDLVVDGGITLGGFQWKQGLELRKGLYDKIKEIVERLST